MAIFFERSLYICRLLDPWKAVGICMESIWCCVILLKDNKITKAPWSIWLEGCYGLLENGTDQPQRDVGEVTLILDPTTGLSMILPCLSLQWLSGGRFSRYQYFRCQYCGSDEVNYEPQMHGSQGMGAPGQSHLGEYATGELFAMWSHAMKGVRRVGWIKVFADVYASLRAERCCMWCNDCFSAIWLLWLTHACCAPFVCCGSHWGLWI